MIERLFDATRAHHASEDADRDGLFHPAVTAPTYLGYLMRVYGFEAPLDEAIAMTPKLDTVLDLRQRSRARLAEQDLVALSLHPAAVASLPMCLAIPQFRGIAEALGWLYVVERATLAHGVMRRHLMTRLPLEIGAASAYLSMYDVSVGTRWQELGAALDDVGQHPAIAERIIGSAIDAFRCRRAWVRSEETSLRRCAG